MAASIEMTSCKTYRAVVIGGNLALRVALVICNDVSEWLLEPFGYRTTKGTGPTEPWFCSCGHVSRKKFIINGESLS